MKNAITKSVYAVWASKSEAQLSITNPLAKTQTLTIKGPIGKALLTILNSTRPSSVITDASNGMTTLHYLGMLSLLSQSRI